MDTWMPKVENCSSGLNALLTCPIVLYTFTCMYAGVCTTRCQGRWSWRHSAIIQSSMWPQLHHAHCLHQTSCQCAVHSLRSRQCFPKNLRFKGFALWPTLMEKEGTCTYSFCKHGKSMHLKNSGEVLTLCTCMHIVQQISFRVSVH